MIYDEETDEVTGYEVECQSTQHHTCGEGKKCEMIHTTDEGGTKIVYCDCVDDGGSPTYPPPTPEPALSGCAFARGDANSDSLLTTADAAYINNWLFLGGPEPVCMDAADSNDDGVLSGADASYILNFLFMGGPPMPSPGSGECWFDVTEDFLTCEVSTPSACL